MRFKPLICKRSQGAADARRRARRRTFVLQVPDNKADAVPCERLHLICSSMFKKGALPAWSTLLAARKPKAISGASLLTPRRELSSQLLYRNGGTET